MDKQTGYTLIDQINKLQYTKAWPDFMKRMSNYIVDKANLVYNAHPEYHFDTLNSEIGVCPCGQGFVIDSMQNVDNYFAETFAIPAIICPKCQQEFKATDYVYNNVVTSYDQDRTIRMVNKTNKEITFDTIIYPVFLWKLMSVNQYIE